MKDKQIEQLINKNGFVSFRSIYKLDNADVVIHPLNYRELRDKDLIDEAPSKMVLYHQMAGWIKEKNIKIYFSTLIRKDKMCVIHNDYA